MAVNPSKGSHEFDKVNTRIHTLSTAPDCEPPVNFTCFTSGSIMTCTGSKELWDNTVHILVIIYLAIYTEFL